MRLLRPSVTIRDYAEIVNVDKSRFEDLRFSVDEQNYFGKDGLYFCGYWISPTGQIREIAMDAKKIAKDIAGKEYFLKIENYFICPMAKDKTTETIFRQ